MGELIVTNAERLLDGDVSLISLGMDSDSQLLWATYCSLPLMELPPLSPGSHESVMEEDVVLDTVSRG